MTVFRCDISEVDSVLFVWYREQMLRQRTVQCKFKITSDIEDPSTLSCTKEGPNTIKSGKTFMVHTVICSNTRNLLQHSSYFQKNLKVINFLVQVFKNILKIFITGGWTTFNTFEDLHGTVLHLYIYWACLPPIFWAISNQFHASASELPLSIQKRNYNRYNPHKHA